MTLRCSRFFARLGLVVALSLPLSGLAASCAFASVDQTDVILGQSLAQSHLDAAESPDIAARNAIVVSSDGTVYFERNADEQVKIASITKVMTALVALENADLTTKVTVDHTAATVGQSSAGLLEGDTLSLESALYALLLPSGNDAALAIAASVGAHIDPNSSDPVAAFVSAMNAKAVELGCNAVYTNPHGLDFDGWEGDMHASARDVATIFATAMKNDEFRTITATPSYTLTLTSADGSTRTISLKTHDQLLGVDGNIGGKTGSTYEALDCFVGAYKRKTGGEIYTVVLGCHGDKERFGDTSTLANWYYNHITEIPVAPTAQITTQGTPLVARVALASWTDKTVDATIKNPDQTVGVFSLGGSVQRSATFSTLNTEVKKGDTVGELTIRQNGRRLAQVDLIAAEDKAAPNPFEWVLVELDRLVRLCTGGSQQAQNMLITPAQQSPKNKS